MNTRGVQTPVLEDNGDYPGGATSPVLPQISTGATFSAGFSTPCLTFSSNPIIPRFGIGLFQINPTTGAAVQVDSSPCIPGASGFWGIQLVHAPDTTPPDPPTLTGKPGASWPLLKFCYRSFVQTNTEVEYTDVEGNPYTPPRYATASSQSLSDPIKVDCIEPTLYTDALGKVFVKLAIVAALPGTTATLPHTGAPTYLEQWIAVSVDYSGLDDTLWNLSTVIYRWFDNGVAPGPKHATLGVRSGYFGPFPAYDLSGYYDTATKVSVIGGITTTTSFAPSTATGFPSTAHQPVPGYMLTSQGATERVWTASNGDTVTFTLSGEVDLTAYYSSYPISAVFAQSYFAGYSATPATEVESGSELPGHTLVLDDVGPIEISGFPLTTVTVNPIGGATSSTLSYTTETYKRLVLNTDGTFTLDNVTATAPVAISKPGSILITIAASTIPMGYAGATEGVVPQPYCTGRLMAVF